MSSKVLNQVGRTIYADDVVTFKGSKKVSITDNLRDIGIRLNSIDTDRIFSEVGKIGSDGVVTAGEKQQLVREWASLKSAFSFASSQADTLGMNGQLVFTNVLSAYTALNSVLTGLLSDTSTDTLLSDVLPDGATFIGLFETYYSKLELLNNEMFQYNTGLLNGLDDRTKCEVRIICSSGLALPDDGSPATLSVTLLKEGTDATADMAETDFTWERQEPGWVGRTGKSIQISDSDLVGGAANFTCRFTHYYSVSMYWYASGFITVQRYVSPISVQVTSTNGDKFRQGTLNTSLIATVFRGDEDITSTVPASAFRWQRRSRDPTADESWNTSSKGLARKSLELTPEDLSGRAVFSCEVDIPQI
jgi:hypothetical protein